MSLKTDVLREIKETSYLTSPKVFHYRAIMRIFYEEYEKMHFQLNKEDVYDILKNYTEFENYDIEQLKQDLSALVEWKNLISIQDPKKVYSIAEYKNKQFRYSMSNNAVEVERLVIKIENLFVESGTLSSNLFSRIYQDIVEIRKMLNSKDLNEVNQWWRTLQNDFKVLNQNYQDYLRDFYSAKSEKMLKSVEFLIHKDNFIKYLREFIQELQINSEKIESSLILLSKEEQEKIVNMVYKSELEIPRTDYGDMEKIKATIFENINGKWNSLYSWFVNTDGKHSESSQVMDVTNEVIRKIIQNASIIVQIQNWGISRKEDYKRYIKMFSECEDLDESHCLSAHLFGVQNILHFKINSQRETESFTSSVYDESPSVFQLRPKVRNYKPKVEKKGFLDKSFEKQIQKEKYLEQVEKEKEMVLKYINDGKIDVSKIENCILEFVRSTILRWISIANSSGSMEAITEYGQKFKLIKQEGYCVLNCEDGTLKMPRYLIEFE